MHDRLYSTDASNTAACKTARLHSAWESPVAWDYRLAAPAQLGCNADSCACQYTSALNPVPGYMTPTALLAICSLACAVQLAAEASHGLQPTEDSSQTHAYGAPHIYMKVMEKSAPVMSWPTRLGLGVPQTEGHWRLQRQAATPRQEWRCGLCGHTRGPCCSHCVPLM